MKIDIHELATIEFEEAIDWYENQLSGLGMRFKKIVIDQIRKIRKHPEWFLIEEDDIYKAYIPKFPYKILFTSNVERITILAVAHLHRKPRYWEPRIEYL
ncbi:MAG: type II toxin-antitoxin system RelE/ParE family toxin [Pseudomonadota bacterium]